MAQFDQVILIGLTVYSYRFDVEDLTGGITKTCAVGGRRRLRRSVAGETAVDKDVSQQRSNAQRLIYGMGIAHRDAVDQGVPCPCRSFQTLVEPFPVLNCTLSVLTEYVTSYGRALKIPLRQYLISPTP